MKAIEGDVCKTCGGPMIWRQARRYPVVSQLLFALSFGAFLLFQDRLAAHKPALWAWSVVQIGLAAWLIRGRLQARQRVLRCIRCTSDLT